MLQSLNASLLSSNTHKSAYFVLLLDLGMSYMVYPGAMHSRFEHSLGVYWLAGEAVQKLKNYQVHPTLYHLCKY